MGVGQEPLELRAFEELVDELVGYVVSLVLWEKLLVSFLVVSLESVVKGPSLGREVTPNQMH